MTKNSRQVIEGFLTTLQSEGPRAAAERYAAESYIQHSPGALPGREGAIAYIENEMSRGGRATVKRIVVDDDIVVLHLHLQFSDGSPDLAIMDMFRIEDGKLAEHWAVSQEIPGVTLSGNSMF